MRDSTRGADALVMCVAFDVCTTGARSAPGDPDPDAPLSAGSARFIARLAHQLSLLHALALQHLRGDEVLDNLTAARRRTDRGPQLPPPLPPLTDAEVYAGAGVGVGVDVDVKMGGSMEGRNATMTGTGDDARNGNEIGTGTAGITVSIVGAGSGTGKEGRGREGEGEGEDLLDAERTCHYHLQGAHATHAATADSREARWSLKKVFLLDERTHEWKACNEAMPLDVLDGVDPAEAAALRRLNSDRPYLVMSWIQLLVILRQETAEGLRVPPPILSRVHQVLSDGFLGFNQADKIAKTPFPMPYSQMLTACLLVFNLTLPIMVAATINSLVMGVALTFISTVAYQGLNEVARELEDPFKPVHLNDLGLPQLQAMFNSKLRAASPPLHAMARCREWVR